MPLYIVTRPKGADNLKNPSGLHGALVEAADAASALDAANALANGYNDPFAGFDTTLLADTASGGFTPALIQGNVLGDAYSGPARGA